MNTPDTPNDPAMEAATTAFPFPEKDNPWGDVYATERRNLAAIIRRHYAPLVEEVERLNGIITHPFHETAMLHETLDKAGCVSVSKAELADLRAKLAEIETAAHGYTLCFPYAQVGSMKPALFKNGSYHYYVPEGEADNLRAQLAAANEDTTLWRKERDSLHAQLCDMTDQFFAVSQQLAAAREVIAEKDEALRPFTHPDLSRLHSNTVEKDASPVYGRDKALLTIGDFKRATAALALTLPGGGEPLLASADPRFTEPTEQHPIPISEREPVLRCRVWCSPQAHKHPYVWEWSVDDETTAVEFGHEKTEEAAKCAAEKARISWQRPIPISERAPVFPCWLWCPQERAWSHATHTAAEIAKKFTAGWWPFTHWLPDQPTAPTVTPKEGK